MSKPANQFREFALADTGLGIDVAYIIKQYFTCMRRELLYVAAWDSKGVSLCLQTASFNLKQVYNGADNELKPSSCPRYCEPTDLRYST